MNLQRALQARVKRLKRHPGWQSRQESHATTDNHCNCALARPLVARSRARN